jgi:probable HAF family extracellular repeat protein
MRRLAPTVVFVVLACAVAARASVVAQSAPAQARWVLTDLGTLAGNGSTPPGAAPPGSFAWGVNNRGQVVGSSTTRDGGGHAFLWQHGTMRDLGVPPGFKTSHATAINDRGEIVGIASVDKDVFHAFLWRKQKARDLGTLGGKQSWATAINNRGQVIGFSTTKTGATHGFLWQNGKMRDIGSFVPSAINDRGQIVGSGRWFPGKYRGQAVLWDNGAIRNLGPLGGTHQASGINERGRIVGVVNGQAALWQRSSFQPPSSLSEAKVRGLGPIAGGGHDYEVPAINERDQIVGTIRNHAFLWERGALQDLGTLPGHTISNAIAINDHGQIVGASGTYNPTKPHHAVLWTLRSAA